MHECIFKYKLYFSHQKCIYFMSQYIYDVTIYCIPKRFASINCLQTSAIGGLLAFVDIMKTPEHTSKQTILWMHVSVNIYAAMSNESDNVWGMREYQNRQVFEMDNGIMASDRNLALTGKLVGKLVVLEYRSVMCGGWVTYSLLRGESKRVLSASLYNST